MALPANSYCDQQGVLPILQKILLKFGEKIEKRDPYKWPEPDCVIETVRGGFIDSGVMDIYSENEEDIREVKMSEFVASLILDCLHVARDKQTSRLLVPDELPQRIADDVMRMSLDEPCGVRGCTMSVILEDGDICQRLGRVAVDPGTVTTFEIVIVLGKETPRWLLSKLQNYLRNSKEQPTIVKSSYKLIKRKLYRKETHMYVHDEF